MTPMQEQYNKIKAEFIDHIILFRLGDFYEAFDDDAIQISKTLGITLTSRGKDDNRTPMAGIPYHALKNYLPKLVNAGHKVAIADQMEEAQPGKIVHRKITKIITPGTIMDESSLEDGKNNFIASVYSYKNLYSFAYSDITTGQLLFLEGLSYQEFRNEIFKISPKEILIINSELEKDLAFLNTFLQVINKTELDYPKNLSTLRSHYKVKSLKSFGINEENKEIINLIGILFKYIEKTQQTALKHFVKVEMINVNLAMTLDLETIRNLELVYNFKGSSENSIYNNLNNCKTSMGRRLLYNWILHPLTSGNLIEERLNLVNEFYKFPRVTASVQSKLEKISDIERICGRIGINSAHPKDLLGLRYSLENSLNIFQELDNNNDFSKDLALNFSQANELNLEKLRETIQIISEAISEDAPAISNEGNIFKNGFDPKLDELRIYKNDSKNILLELQKNEIEKTGISSLKITFNNVFGYYIEVTNTNLSKVPERYIRKQTLANCERFITPELKIIEEKIFSSESEIIKLEFKLFDILRSKLSEALQEMLNLSVKIAEIDVIASFGSIARAKEYAKPIISKNKLLTISEGRHPIVEGLVDKFVPNDSHFDFNNTIHILTGPNMSGKSTYIRQVAIIALMAQIGSFVPAKEMAFMPFDRIFTRVGASDNLAKGESTFMVEMTETANILNNSTKNSLIIFDEVGRGTSTYDGVAIAWSIIDYLSSKIKAFTLFATHYHELIALADNNNSIKNFNVEVDDSSEDIVFKHKMVKGGTNRSYGVHVAKLAGLPSEIIANANSILRSFEDSNKTGKILSEENYSSESKDKLIEPNNKFLKEKVIKVQKPRNINPNQLDFLSVGGTK